MAKLTNGRGRGKSKGKSKRGRKPKKKEIEEITLSSDEAVSEKDEEESMEVSEQNGFTKENLENDPMDQDDSETNIKNQDQSENEQNHDDNVTLNGDTCT